MIININHRRKIIERMSFSYLSFTPFFFNFQLVCAYVCVVFSVLIFSMCVSLFSACVLVFIFIMNKVTTKFLPLVKLQGLCHDDI
jgi:uncharacterized membrane protein